MFKYLFFFKTYAKQMFCCLRGEGRKGEGVDDLVCNNDDDDNFKSGIHFKLRMFFEWTQQMFYANKIIFWQSFQLRDFPGKVDESLQHTK